MPDPTKPDQTDRELATKLRMIVSHATGGSSQDIDASVNDICVRITENRNHVFQHGKDVGLEDAAKVARDYGAQALHGERVFAREHAANIASAIDALIGETK